MASSSSSSRSAKKAVRGSSSSSRSGTTARSKTTVMGFTFDDFAILAVESRQTEEIYNEVDEKDFKKFFEVFDNIFLGFTGASACVQFLRKNLPKWCNQLAVAPVSMEAAVDHIVTYINNVCAAVLKNDRIDVDILAIGAVGNEPFRMFLIKKETNPDPFTSQQVNDHKICLGSGSGVIGNFMMSCRRTFNLEEASHFALEGIRYATTRDWNSGNAIFLITIHRGFATQDKFGQDNFRQCSDEYTPR